MSPDPAPYLDPVIERVAGAAPVRDDVMSDVSIAAALADLAGSIPAQPAAASRGWRARLVLRRYRAVIVTTAILSLSATAAVGYTISAHTGFFGAPGMTEEDTTEFLNTGAEDFPALLRTIVPNEIALPPGDSWTPATDALIATGRRDSGLQQAAGIRGGLAQYAYCSWVGRWLEVHSHGDAEAAAAAATGIALVARSPVVARVDGGGVVAGMQRVASQAARGQVAPMRAEYKLNCNGQR